MSKKKKHIPLPCLPPGVSLVDTHCHLDMMENGEDPADIIERAFAAGVTRAVTIGIDPASSRKAVELADRLEHVYAAVGIHPHHSEQLSLQSEKELQRLAGGSRVIAFGEIGIDTVKDYAPLDVQQRAFTRQLEMARELDLPVIVHNREAHEEIYQRLKKSGPFPRGGVIHCFSGDGEIARKFIDLGFYISIPGVVTFNRADMLHDAVRSIPLDFMLVETDAPFLAPVPYRGKINEPLFTLYTAQKIAELKGLDLAEVARVTTANARRLFNIS